MTEQQTQQRDTNNPDDMMSFREEVITPYQIFDMIAELFYINEHIAVPKPAKRLEVLLFQDKYQKNNDNIIRYKRVYALFKAYNLLIDLDNYSPVNSFINGKFIKYEYLFDKWPRDEVVALIKGARMNEELGIKIDDLLSKPRDYRHFFYGLMKYRLNIFKCENCIGYDVPMTAGLSVSIDVANRLGSQYLFWIKDSLNNLMLAFLRDNPKVKDYTIGELIDNYGFPAVTDYKLRIIGLSYNRPNYNSKESN